MSANCQSWTALSGRLFLAAIFLFSGFGKIMDWSGTAQHMEKEGMVMVPLFLAGAIAFEILGGLMVLFGFRARIGAALLILFLIPTTLIFHDFWQYAGMERMQQTIHFMKNLAMMGGLLMVAAFGPGRISFDERRWPGETDHALWERRGQSVPVG